MKFTLGSSVFPSKGHARKRVREILHGAVPCLPLQGEEFDMIKGLVSLHPSAADKIGVGIRSICVRLQKIAPYSRVFSILRWDGSEATFSYRKCLDKCLTDHKALALQAMRQAVVYQVINAKNWYFEVECDEEGRVFSSVEQRWLTWAECNLDHYPTPFSTIADNFVERHFTGYDQIAVQPSEWGLGEEMADKGQKQLWQEWHEQHADYRIISATLNRKLSNRGRDYAQVP